ncbi:MAG TPA: RNA polymerase subunit sigma-70 [Polyangia bacterium]|nr:RNA polymerase subunit sigma-70 [Polyangia bacterium]
MEAAKNQNFEARLEPHRRAIILHCYRMLGSLQDAEEAAQESLLRAWQRLHELEDAGAAKAWLYRIATNVCLDLLKKAKRRRRALPFLTGPAADPAAPWAAPAPESAWIEPAPDLLLDVADDADRRPDARVSLRESVGLAFVTALQFLPAKQRAALLLVDVLGWKPQEAAHLLGVSMAATSSLLQRARRTVAQRNPAEAAPHVDDDRLLQRYITTWESRDLEAFAALLAEDAVLSMPPQAEWYAGREAILRFLGRVLTDPGRRYRSLITRANGGPAAAVYVSTAGGPFLATAINVLSFRNGQVARMTRFTSARLFRPFGLPAQLTDAGA